jgi:hypothetical protein
MIPWALLVVLVLVIYVCTADQSPPDDTDQLEEDPRAWRQTW